MFCSCNPGFGLRLECIWCNHWLVSNQGNEKHEREAERETDVTFWRRVVLWLSLAPNETEAFTPPFPFTLISFTSLPLNAACHTRAGPAPCGERSVWNVGGRCVTTGTKMNRFEKLMRIANISVSLSLALPMWAWDIKPPVIQHEKHLSGK